MNTQHGGGRRNTVSGFPKPREKRDRKHRYTTLIDPIPPAHHPEFTRFMSQIKRYTDEQYGRWSYASHHCDSEYVQHRKNFFKEMRKFLSFIVWMGTHNVDK